MVINTNNNGLIVKPICATGSIQRFVGDIGIKVCSRKQKSQGKNKIFESKY